MESTHTTGRPTHDPRFDGALRGLTDPDREVRQAAALTLGTIANPAAAQVLAARLGSEPDFFVRDTLSWALTRIPDSATPLLVDALHGTDTTTCVQALHVLSKIADPATTKAIMELTTHTNPRVASKARWALTRIANPMAIPALIVHLGTGDNTTQNDLTRDLASFGAAAVPALTAALSDKEAGVRNHATEVLCFIGHDAKDATVALTRALEDIAPEVRLSAAMALFEISTPESLEALSRHTESDDSRLRAIAIRSQSAGTRKG